MIDWLIDTTLYTGLLIALVLLVRRTVARWFGPQLAYALWALPLARLVLPPIVLPATFAPAVQPVQPPAPAITPEGLAPAPAAFAAAGFDTATLLLPAVLVLWLGGGLAFVCWRIVAYRRMRRVVLERARPVGEVGAVRLVETPAVGAPVAFGVRDKVIALPPLFMAQPDRTRRDLAIAHELAHHRGHDLAANFAAQALLALHWWNPLAWLGWRAMRRDQEAACDARVLAGRGREERVRYAALIAGIAAGPRLALAAPMACPILGEASILHRLRHLSRPSPSARRRWLGCSLLATGALALPLTASISYAAATPMVAPLPPALPAAPSPPAPPPTPPAAPDATPASWQRVPAPSAPAAPPVPSAPPAGLPDREPMAAFERRMEAFAARMEHFDPFDEAQLEWLEREEERIERGAERLAAQAERDAERWAEQAERAAEAAARARDNAAQAAERAQARSVARTAAAARRPSRPAPPILALVGTRPALAIACTDPARSAAAEPSPCHIQAAVEARNALLAAQRAIMTDAALSASLRQQVLRHLDSEVARLRVAS